MQGARGTDEENRVYCSKENNILLQFGIPNAMYSNDLCENAIYAIGLRIIPL